MTNPKQIIKFYKNRCRAKSRFSSQRELKESIVRETLKLKNNAEFVLRQLIDEEKSINESVEEKIVTSFNQFKFNSHLSQIQTAIDLETFSDMAYSDNPNQVYAALNEEEDEYVEEFNPDIHERILLTPEFSFGKAALVWTPSISPARVDFPKTEEITEKDDFGIMMKKSVAIRNFAIWPFFIDGSSYNNKNKPMDEATREMTNALLCLCGTNMIEETRENTIEHTNYKIHVCANPNLSKKCGLEIQDNVKISRICQDIKINDKGTFHTTTIDKKLFPFDLAHPKLSICLDDFDIIKVGIIPTTCRLCPPIPMKLPKTFILNSKKTPDDLANRGTLLFGCHNGNKKCFNLMLGKDFWNSLSKLGIPPNFSSAEIDYITRHNSAFTNLFRARDGGRKTNAATTSKKRSHPSGMSTNQFNKRR